MLHVTLCAPDSVKGHSNAMPATRNRRKHGIRISMLKLRFFIWQYICRKNTQIPPLNERLFGFPVQTAITPDRTVSAMAGKERSDHHHAKAGNQHHMQPLASFMSADFIFNPHQSFDFPLSGILK